MHWISSLDEENLASGFVKVPRATSERELALVNPIEVPEYSMEE